jgi:GNAT superfamily N-acetyltransferase
MVIDLVPGFTLRRATGADHAALSEICLKTGDSGADASGIEDDPALLGAIYAIPYQVFEPDFAFVVEDAQGICGSLLGTPDTPAFDARTLRDWFPALATTIPDPGPDPATWKDSDWARHRVHSMASVFPAALGPYRAQAHIDLLPRAQGKGVGRRAMTEMMARLHAAGAKGLHLHVSPQNLRAQAFYLSLGFIRLDDATLPKDTVFMVRPLTAP